MSIEHGDEYLYRKMVRIRESRKTVSQQEQNKYTNAYEQLKRKYKNKYDQDIKSGVAKADATPKHRAYNWAGLNLKEKANTINQEQFHQLYKDLSNLSHVSIGATLDAIANSTKNNFVVDLSLYSSPVHCFPVLAVMFTCISGILEEYMTHFKIERSDYPILANLWNDYQELLKK